MTASAPDPRAQLPSMTALLEDERVQRRIVVDGRRRVVDALRSALDAAREAATSPSAVTVTHDEVVGSALASLDAQEARRSRRVLNATGVVLHTNLGRAPLSEAAVRAMADAAGATNVEYDLADGRRGGRAGVARAWLAELCGAEAAAVVNNGAGALVLAMAALAREREVVVARGELVEIGGSFRLPEILEAAGVVLREVGTTNRTHVRDYEQAVGASTGALLRVHTSNYRIEGFVAAPTDHELAAVARHAGVPLVLDLGSGLLQPSEDRALQDEPDATSALAAGADLVVFSGDKLLGGPQAGVLAGDGGLVARCERHPLARALRVDKARLAALEATLEAYLRDATFELPTWTQLLADPDELERRACDLADGLDVEVVRTTSVPGGGSLPGVTLPSWGVVVPGHAEQLASAFRRAAPPVVGRIEDGSFVLDLRTIPREDDVVLRAVITSVLDRL